MPTNPAGPQFPQSVVFHDVEETRLRREEPSYVSGRAVLAERGAWQAYLNKMLPPIVDDRSV